MSDRVSMTIRIPKDVHQRVRISAAIEGESLNAWVLGAIKAHINDVAIETQRRSHLR